jgi:hypothetical protein
MAAKRDLKRGMPTEVINAVDSTLSKLHELFSDTGAYLIEGAVFSVTDDQYQAHLLFVEFDANRGDGEYILVTK